jgi:hypothetical protein
MAYQPGIPTGTVPLNQDYLNLQGNFSSLDAQWKVDHVPLTNTGGVPPAGDNGYHTFVHLVPFSTTTTNPTKNQPVVAPAATAGYGQLFGAEINDGINTDQALYYLSGGNRLTQLTRNVQPVTAPNGYTFLPGGLLFQWGASSTGPTPGTTPTSFNIAFTSVYNVTVTPNGSLGVSPTPGLKSVTIGTPGSFIINNSSNQVFTFLWTAIGI